MSGNGPCGEVAAVTAIARPELFVANAREAGAEVGPTLFFPDHHDYDELDLDRIRRAAAGRPIVTTAKDMVKLAPLAPDLDLWVLEQEVVVEEGESALHELLDEIVARSGVPTP
jgi:tetraacyldisaccharide 4'-kinase